jgi:hypothetical protein
LNTKHLFGSVSLLGILFAAVLLLNIAAVQAADCVGGGRLEFVSWDNFGVVKMQYVNTSDDPMRLTDFTVIWGNIVTRAGLAPGVLTLRQVTVGGASPADALTTHVWSAAPGQDSTSPTVGLGEGTWLTDYVFPPNSTTSIYIDFDGTSSNLQAAFGAQLSDLNGTTFIVTPDCSPNAEAEAEVNLNAAIQGITDGRLNSAWGDHFAVIYATDGAGNPALRIYRVGDNSTGWLALAVNVEDIPAVSDENILIASDNGIAVYLLTSGEIQITLGPDETGKFYNVVIDALPATSIHYSS